MGCCCSLSAWSTCRNPLPTPTHSHSHALTQPRSWYIYTLCASLFTRNVNNCYHQHSFLFYCSNYPWNSNFTNTLFILYASWIYHLMFVGTVCICHMYASFLIVMHAWINLPCFWFSLLPSLLSLSLPLYLAGCTQKQDHFQILMLTQIMRQKEETAFAAFWTGLMTKQAAPFQASKGDLKANVVHVWKTQIDATL